MLTWFLREKSYQQTDTLQVICRHIPPNVGLQDPIIYIATNHVGRERGDKTSQAIFGRSVSNNSVLECMQ